MQRSLVVITTLLISTVSFSIYSCSKSTVPTASDPFVALNLPDEPFKYANQGLPFYLQTPLIAGQDNSPANNPVTDWGATLGRVLFYDKAVSINNTISCSSCHQQANGFSDAGVKSKGFAGGSTTRHSMSLVNARYYPKRRFFWDERAATLELQVLTPIQDHTEMGMTLDTLVARLQKTAHYPVLFKNAFGDAAINSTRISNALSQFVRSIISFRSKFDAGRSQVPPGVDPIQTPYTNFTTQENAGKQLFFSPALACATCHGTETFTAPGDRNNGLDNPIADKGVGGINNMPLQDGNFKATSLKSIALTAPYMHDGRFATLEQVIEHYNSGVKANPNLAPQLKNPDGTPRRLNLTNEQKAALLAFLRTLTDDAISTDSKFSNPFK